MYTEENSMRQREANASERLLHTADNKGYVSNNGCCGNTDNIARCVPSKTFGIEGYPLASMYAPMQKFRNLYDMETALTEGTLFSELNLPFMGASVTKGGCLRD